MIDCGNNDDWECIMGNEETVLENATKGRTHDTIALGVCLSLVGGFLDAYSYLCYHCSLRSGGCNRFFCNTALAGTRDFGMRSVYRGGVGNEQRDMKNGK